MRIQVLKKKHWYYRIIGSNNQVLLTSETYCHKANAKRAAVNFRRYFLNKHPNVEVLQENKMKNLIALILLIVVLATSAYAYGNFPSPFPCQTDYKCLNDCTMKGYQYAYCKQLCTWCE